MFNKILGNEKIKQELIGTIEKEKVSHSYLFIGKEGIGKRLIAKEFSKRLLCLNNEEDNCKSCLEFENNNHPDFYYIDSEDGKSIKIEQIRYMQKKVQEKPIISKRKIYIIDNADLMTLEAQNCLLKTLEEPPEFVTIILIGQNEDAFLATIKSRCMILRFKSISNELVQKYMEENYDLKNINSAILKSFEGSIGKAIKLKDKINTYEEIYNLIYSMETKDIIDIVNMAEIIYKSKDEILDILEYINVILINLAQKSYKYTNCIQIVENTKKRLTQNGNYDMCIDNMLFNIWEEVN
ncbi:MAG: hypothetical protein IJH39_04175 [Clostridia bacterium]|nr:hypothetical protein [Clostridia bacterium]